MMAAQRSDRLNRRPRKTLGWMIVLLGIAPWAEVQTTPYERTFPQSPATVEKILKDLRSTAGGRLPVLEGFADPADRPLDRFKRGYYQCTAQVTSTPSGGSRVKISAKITAWYTDPDTGKSGYQLLVSNGRVEADFLDQLQETLAKPAARETPPPTPAAEPQKTEAAQPTISAPVEAALTNAAERETPPPTSPAVEPTKTEAADPALSASLPQPALPSEPASSKRTASGSSPFNTTTAPTPAPPEDSLAGKTASDSHIDELTEQAKNLEEILRNQAHPNNLVAVKKSGTPIFASPNEGAKVVFQAAAEDEFEMLDLNPNWVHVRISGLSRGWIVRSGVEMPGDFEAAPETRASPAVARAPSERANQAPFSVENEEIASFPGNWEPLRGKTVKIISVQEAKEKAKATDSQAKLEFAKSLFNREYADLTRNASTAAGVVVVFDSADGGMMAATLAVLEQWKSGTLSDQALWHRCYFDPPELFSSSSSSTP
jgi:hypothetical protein